ncbi:hypothetical protein RI054_30g122230 [Pseudoscourfieldia marina]
MPDGLLRRLSRAVTFAGAGAGSGLRDSEPHNDSQTSRRQRTNTNGAPASSSSSSSSSQTSSARIEVNLRDRTEQFKLWRGVADSMAVQMGVPRPPVPAPEVQPLVASPLQNAADKTARLRPQLRQLLERRAEATAALENGDELTESTRQGLYGLLSLLDEELPQKLAELKAVCVAIQKVPTRGNREAKLKANVSASALECLRMSTVSYRGLGRGSVVAASTEAAAAVEASNTLRQQMRHMHEALETMTALYGAVWRAAKCVHEHPALSSARASLALPAQQAKQGCARAVESLLRESAMLSADGDTSTPRGDADVRRELAQMDRDAAATWTPNATASAHTCIASYRAVAARLRQAVELARTMRDGNDGGNGTGGLQSVLKAATATQQFVVGLGNACDQLSQKR